MYLFIYSYIWQIHNTEHGKRDSAYITIAKILGYILIVKTLNI